MGTHEAYFPNFTMGEQRKKLNSLFQTFPQLGGGFTSLFVLEIWTSLHIFSYDWNFPRGDSISLIIDRKMEIVIYTRYRK